MQKNYSILIKIAGGFSVVAFMIFIVLLGWYFMPFANNPIQNSRLKILHDEISALELKNTHGEDFYFSKFSVYAGVCRLHIPFIWYNDCLPILVEGRSILEAKENCEKIRLSIGSIMRSPAAQNLKGKYLVLVPAVRDRSFTGGVNPYNVNKFFERSQPLIIKLGD